MALYPFASGSDVRLDESELYITLSCAIAIVLVILSDRLTSLKVTRNSFEIELENIRNELSTTIHEAKTAMPSKAPKFIEIENLVTRNRSSESEDIIKEAKAIGEAMKMLRVIMHEYKQENS